MRASGPHEAAPTGGGDQPQWMPSAERVAKANLTRFMAAARHRWGAELADYAALHRWSVARPDQFWPSLWDFAQVIASARGEVVLADGDKMPGARFFPDARLNFAENLLRRRDESPAIIFRNETSARRCLSHAELHADVSRLAQALQELGIEPGDRVAGFIPNLPEAIIAMLAATSLGAVWSSCSPDFGIDGAIDRFGQIEPKVLFAADGYIYNGKTIDSLARAKGIAAALPSLEKLVLIPYLTEAPALDGLGDAVLFADLLAPFEPRAITFRQLPFNHPVYILYSSGTTGAPKCIVHSAGGALLQHLKEQRLHCDVKPGDVLFYFTTCGWMMWNWLASGLASEATLLLYDGSPFHPDGSVLFHIAAAERIAVFGTSAKFLDAAQKAGIEPRRGRDLGSLKTILSTGSPLQPEAFDYVYDKIKSDLCLSSMSGGTDLIACFAGGNPIGPVWRGEIQALALGMDVAVFDQAGRAVRGEKGELVCTGPFPSLPLGFWNDPGDVKYHEAYFDVFPNVWRHGDYVEITAHGGMIIYGRSDAVLNPGGVRIGTAEIYRQAEQLNDVVESLVIGQHWEDDVRVVLFVKLRQGLVLDDGLRGRIKQRIRDGASPRHVPAKIVQVADIPRTISGKIVELAVRDVVHGRPVTNQDALANPEALDEFRDRPELAS